MAKISGKYKNVAIALITSACLGRQAMAENTAVKSPTTQPSTEVFDVKEKDLPADKSKLPGADIPPPDFKAFDDDKFINNLIDSDAKNAPVPGAAPAPKKSEDRIAPVPTTADVLAPKPTSTDKPQVKPDEVMDSVLKGDAGAAPADSAGKDKAAGAAVPPAQNSDSKTVTQPASPDVSKPPAAATDAGKTPDISVAQPAAPAQAQVTDKKLEDAGKNAENKAVPQAAGAVPAGTVPATTPDATKQNPVATEAPKVDNGAQQPPAAQNPGAVTQAPAAEEKKADKTPVANTADGLTDSERQSYVDLKQHLSNFIGSFHGKTPVAVSDNKNVESKDAKTANAPEQVATENKDAAIQTAANAENKDSSVQQPAVASGEKPLTPGQAVAPVAQAPAVPGETKQALEKAPEQKAMSDKPEVKEAKEEKKQPEAKAPSDNFDDFLEPQVKQPPVPAKQAGVAAPASEAKKPEQKPEEKKAEEKKVASSPVSTDIKNPDAAKTPNADVVAPLPPKKQPEVKEETNLDVVDVQKPEEKEKLTDADKAYFKLLDKKHDSLPADKKLSNATLSAIEGFSSALTPLKKGAKKPPQYIKVEHGKFGDAGVEDAGVIKSQNKMDIEVRKVGKGDDFEKTKVKLEKAYKALLVGQNAAAISIYKDVLAKEPDNKDAMFGLATSYHKNAQYDQAREIYTNLLKKHPGDKEALNNFLVLVGEEAPEDALIELEKLERVNSNFSPVAAQIAMINLRLGDSEKAARYLRRAILLSPDNVSYKYNLAVVYDKSGKEEQAIQLYRQVIDAAKGGAVVPGSVAKIVERAEYLENKVSEKK